MIPNCRANVYSAEEIAIGKWIDGKTIYRKVINFKNSSSINTWTKIAEFNFDRIIKTYGYTIHKTEIYPLPNSNATSSNTAENISFYWDYTKKEIYEKHNYSYANSQESYLIVEYTKTTD